MDPFFTVVAFTMATGTLGAVLAGVLVAERSRAGRGDADPRRTAALALGLSQDSADRPTSLYGAVDGRSVSVVWEGHGESWFSTGETTLSVGGLPQGFRLGEHEDLLIDVTTGDEAFDDAVPAAGDRALVLAALTSTARQAWKSPGPGVVALWDGALRLRMRRCVYDPDRLGAALKHAMSLVEALDPTDAVEPRLAHNARTDPVEEVRMHNATVLLRECDGAISDVIARWALDQNDVRLVIEGARHLHDVERLIAVLENPEHESYQDNALEALVEVADRDTALKHVGHALESETWAVRTRAVMEVGHLKARELLWRLNFLVTSILSGQPTEWDELTLRIAARTARDVGGDEAETILIRMLEAGDREVRLRAIEGLAAIGTPRAVEPLMNVDVMPLTPLDRAATDAIRAIQARVLHPEAGTLTLAVTADGTGALSLAEDDPEAS